MMLIASISNEIHELLQDKEQSRGILYASDAHRIKKLYVG